ncbi:MAG: bifunctional (p)ppGpp synthetase/guanosine-3',5'-bis(diphosphate) 3'-pyrophosphohydrolase [gamma proteobacterium endosymbiont of Lamellibrachia anaximandri]|nr:bifunctional (p)ppGpp synthetase/guanosine-3',5'-bis(diphosphate) 3'-pyrophosphohydrolase [gamma proteobacterium endosymbiont of Lamellibrachia anaximandri]
MVSVTTSLPEGTSVDQQGIDAWLEAYGQENSREDVDYLRDACELALDAGGDVFLPSGETRLRHGLSVAEILFGMRLDRETLAAAILLGSLTDATITLEQLEARFGKSVATMVDDLTRIEALTGLSSEAKHVDEAEHAENLRRLLLGIAEDVRVVLVVVGERLHLMRIAREFPEETRLRLAQETRAIYAPLANRLGIWQVKWELEDLSLRFLHPADYKRLASQLDGRREEREQFISEVIELLDGEFRKQGIEADINGRPKHIYSIWRKMQRKAVDIEQIFDLRAVRVLVSDIAQCYEVLGIVHGLWKHIPGEFDDYIATPKANMYQSIHTAVIGPEDKTLEVQIRTQDMHHHSELGVAAHWRYKENAKHDADFELRVVWMRHWLDLKDSGDDYSDHLEQLDTEMEATRIYVLTPQSKVVELPKGSTPLDFAYAVHTDIGHRCRGAKVDGHIVQLTRPLKSGEIVEVLTSKNGTPSRDWINPHLGYLKSSRARSRVRQWFKHLDYEHYVELGRAALDREIVRLSVIEKPDLEEVAERHNLKQVDDVYAAIGRGELSPVHVAGSGIREKQSEQTELPLEKTRPKAQIKGEVVVDGVDDLMTTMARCCKPVPYDSIVGYVTRGRGVTVHRRNCSNIRAMDEDELERLVEVGWSDQHEESTYPVDIRILAADRKGLLRDISSIFTSDEVDVISVTTNSDRKTDTASMQFTVEVNDMEQLSRLLTKVEQLPDVMDVKRVV